MGKLSGGGAPADVAYLLAAAAADARLPNSVAGGAAPLGELGGTWPAPTVDATHSGSVHLTTRWDYYDITTAAASQRVAIWYPFGGTTADPTVLSGLYDISGSTTAPTVGNDATTGQVRIRFVGNTTVGNRFAAFLMSQQVRAAEDFEFKCLVQTVTEPVGGTVVYYFGARLNNTTGAQDGIYIRRTNTGNFFLVCRNGGVETTSDLGEGLTTTLKELEVRVSSAGTSVRGYINGVAVGVAITTNIPPAILTRVGIMLDNEAITITTGATFEAYEGMGRLKDIVA